jgi:uncharacterized protein YdaU (DUF1376 family)
MKDLPYFPLYAAELEAETAHLSIEEDGVYNRLLRQMWMQPGCSLPADEKWLRRRLRVTSEQFEQVVKPVIDEFFEKKRDRLHSPLLTAEFEKIAETREKRSSAGKKGADARKGLKSQENDPSRASAKNQPGLSNIYSELEPELEPDTYSETDTHHIRVNPGCIGGDDEKVVPLRRETQPEQPDCEDAPIGGIAPGCRGLHDEFEIVWSDWRWRDRDIEKFPGKDIPGKTQAAYCIARRKASFRKIVSGIESYTEERLDEDDEYTAHLRNWLYAERWLDEYGETAPEDGEPDFLSKAAADAMEGWT